METNLSVNPPCAGLSPRTDRLACGGFSIVPDGPLLACRCSCGASATVGSLAGAVAFSAGPH